MRIKSVQIKNFRAFADETINLDPYTCLVGANGAGKSTLLCALNVFFRDSSNSTTVDVLSAEDFHKKNVGERIEIKLTFTDLSEGAQLELKDYVRNGELIVAAIAEYDGAKGHAPVKQVGSRMGIPAFAEFFAKHKANGSAADLTAIFDRLKAQHPDIPIRPGRVTKDSMRDALREFEDAPENSGLLGPLESEDQFYGIAGNSKLRAHLQWVYVPAVKDATDEQMENRDSALGKLLARTVRARVNFKEQLAQIEANAKEQYDALLGDNQAALDAVAQSLSRRLGEWSHPDVDLKLNWNGSGISIREPSAKLHAGERGFEGEIARFGHGFQRSYLLALLQELAELEGDEGPTLILGVEEPELYQHPPQARYLSQILQSLGDAGDQVFVTTHSPHFVGGENFERVRLVRKGPLDGVAKVYATTHARFAERYANADEAQPQAPRAVAAQINEVLRPNLNEMFFASKLVLVEGREDVAYVLSWIALTGRLPRYRSSGVHIVSVEGKSNLAKPLIVAQELGIPSFVVFDGDRAVEAKHRPRHISDNSRLLRVLGMNDADPFTDQPRWGEGFVQWPDDLRTVVVAELVASLGQDAYDRIVEQARVLCGLAPDLSKNTFFIQHKLELARAAGARVPTLDALCDALVA